MSFTFKHFHINDSNCAMKVGTDGVLLGAFADMTGVNTVLDVGAGSGLVSLMLAQRSTPKTIITGVELDAGAYRDCVDNFEQSEWNCRLKCLNTSFTSVGGYYDMIISNPPFFKDALSAKGESRSLARQGDELNYISLIKYASEHLTPEGKLVMITDIQHEKDIIFTAEMSRLKIRRLRYIKSFEYKPVFRIIWEFGRTDVEDIDRNVIIIKNPDGHWHEDYINLTKDYYLNI